MTKTNVYKECCFIRKQIESCKANGYFLNFPSGYCALCSIWVYDYLLYKGLDSIQIRQKDNFITEYPHTWLYWNGLDIDITADQFDKIIKLPKVYVGNTNLLYHSFNNITTKERKFETEFILKNAFVDRTLEEGIKMLYCNITLDINLFYNLKPEA
ncbi:MAG: hypothetical protein EGP72_06545 [Phocaeicola plebeius]|nr:hypothetical protein [Phocaeicola plebeius]